MRYNVCQLEYRIIIFATKKDERDTIIYRLSFILIKKVLVVFCIVCNCYKFPYKLNIT